MFMGNSSEEEKKPNRTLYKIRKKEAKKSITDAKTKSLEKIYSDLDTKG